MRHHGHSGIGAGLEKAGLRDPGCPRSRTPWVRQMLTVFLVTIAGLTACGRSSPQAQRAPCATTANETNSASPVLASAALLLASVEVSPQQTGHPKCLPLTPGSVAHLLIGDRAEFVANGSPGLEPADEAVVTISTLPGPIAGGPGLPGGIPTSHVIVRLTAVRPGNVTVDWTNCSGTGC